MRIAITGGIADGKSAILSMVAELGYPTTDADSVVRALQTEPDYLEAVRRSLGDDAVDGGGLRRKHLRELISKDPAARRTLNRLTHKPVLHRLLLWSKAQAGASFVEIPLLIETCSQGLFDQVWVAQAGRDVQLERLTERLKDRDQADMLLKAQLPTEVKAVFADALWRTNSYLDTVRSTVTRHVEELGLNPG